MINVTIDQGNTRTKLSVWASHRICFQTSGASLSAHIIGEIVDRFGSIGNTIISSVAQSSEEIVSLMQRYSAKVTLLSHTTPMPLKLDYRTPQTLGRDRIAAMVGAMQLFPGQQLLVVDAGTAVTFDAVSPQGHFIGGNIAPGIAMRLEALHRFTARLPLVEVAGELPSLGYDTPTAMRSGAVMGVVAEIVHHLNGLPGSTQPVITGGDAKTLEPLLSKFNPAIEPNLVHIGLNSIIEYNENQ